MKPRFRFVELELVDVLYKSWLDNFFMSDSDLCCGGLFLLFFGLALLYGGVQKYLLAQKIKNTPTSKVRSAAVGLVELVGKAICKDEIFSPISKRKSAFWIIHGEYYKPGKHGGWRTIYNASSPNQFYLEDDTGRMLIEPKGAEIDIPSDLSSTGHLTEGGILGVLKNKLLDAKVLAFIESDPAIKRTFNSYSGYELRVTESFIAENDPLYVLGNAEHLKGASSAIAHENLIITFGSEKIMYISDSKEEKAIEKTQGPLWWMIIGGLIGSSIGLFLLLSQFIN